MVYAAPLARAFVPFPVWKSSSLAMGAAKGGLNGGEGDPELTLFSVSEPVGRHARSAFYSLRNATVPLQTADVSSRTEGL